MDDFFHSKQREIVDDDVDQDEDQTKDTSVQSHGGFDTTTASHGNWSLFPCHQTSELPCHLESYVSTILVSSLVNLPRHQGDVC